MRRLPRIDLSTNLWESSPSSETSDNEATSVAVAVATTSSTDNDSHNRYGSQWIPTLRSSLSVTTLAAATTTTTQQSLPSPLITNLTPNRRSLLPAYPSFERSNNRNQEEHLLRPHIPRKSNFIAFIRYTQASE